MGKHKWEEIKSIPEHLRGPVTHHCAKCHKLKAPGTSDECSVEDEVDEEEKLCPRCTKASEEVGETVWCAVCPRSKCPRGRDGGMYASYCTAEECDGYEQEPFVGSLWPGESRLDFGYGGVMTEPCTCEETP